MLSESWGNLSWGNLSGLALVLLALVLLALVILALVLLALVLLALVRPGTCPPGTCPPGTCLPGTCQGVTCLLPVLTPADIRRILSVGYYPVALFVPNIWPENQKKSRNPIFTSIFRKDPELAYTIFEKWVLIIPLHCAPSCLPPLRRGAFLMHKVQSGRRRKAISDTKLSVNKELKGVS